MLLTGAQSHPSKCREHVCRLSSLTIFLVSLAVAPLRLSPPTLPFSSPCLFLPTHPHPPKPKLSVARFSRGCAPSEHQSKISCQNSPETVQILGQRKCPWCRFSTDLQPVSNRFSTDFQPIFNRAPRPQPICNRATDSQPFFNRFSTDFQPIVSRFSTVFATDFQPCSEPGGPK